MINSRVERAASEAAELVVPAADELRTTLASHQQRMTGVVESRLETFGSRLDSLASRRVFSRPEERVRELARRVDELSVRFRRTADLVPQRAKDRTATLAARLESLSPLAVLARGYSVTEHAATGRVVRDASQVQLGDALHTRLAKGQITSRVEQIEQAES